VAYNLKAARDAGVPDSEIADHLANLHGYQISKAREAGVTDTEIADHLSKKSTTIAKVKNAITSETIAERAEKLPASSKEPSPRDVLQVDDGRVTTTTDRATDISVDKLIAPKGGERDIMAETSRFLQSNDDILPEQTRSEAVKDISLPTVDPAEEEAKARRDALIVLAKTNTPEGVNARRILDEQWGEYARQNARQNRANANPITSDAATDFMIGVAQIPGAAIGLLDIAPALVFGGRPADYLFDEIGKVTGFHPSEYAKRLEQDYSDIRKQGQEDIAAVWDDETKGWWDVTKEYAANPGVTAGNVVKSLPIIAAGGVVGRIAMLKKAGLAPVTAGAIGEGSMMAGSQMQDFDESVDARKAALASLATGVLGAAIGKYGGALASKLGIRDVDTLVAGGAVGGVTSPFYKRIPAAMVQEGIIEEATQSSMEQMLKNIAEDKPVMEGVDRATVEGTLAGSAMGGMASAPGIYKKPGMLTRAVNKAQQGDIPDGAISADEVLGAADSLAQPTGKEAATSTVEQAAPPINGGQDGTTSTPLDAGLDTGTVESGNPDGEGSARNDVLQHDIDSGTGRDGVPGAPLESDGKIVTAQSGDRTKAVIDAKSEIDEAAREAATSPENNLPEPTQGQKEAGNYKKGHTTIHGMDVAIENPQGSERKGVDPDGKAWKVNLPAHYGYIKRTEGADGDHVDVYIGPNPESAEVFVVDQVDAKTTKFDEHKVMIGFKSEAEATTTYKAGFSDGKGADRIGSITPLSMDEFKGWLKDGDTKNPLAKQVSSNVLRKHIETLIKFKRNAGQVKLAPQLENAINKAKNALKTGKGKASDFKKLAKVFKGKDDAISTELLSIADMLESSRPAQKKPQKASSDLLQRIKQLGGVDIGSVLDITGEPKAPGAWKFAFRKAGRGLDDLATVLAAEGFAIDTNDVDGGVQQLKDMIRAHINGERNFRHIDIEEQAERNKNDEYLNSLYEEADKLGIKVDGMSQQQIEDAVYAEEDARIMASADAQGLNDGEAEVSDAIFDGVVENDDLDLDNLTPSTPEQIAAWLGEDNGQEGNSSETQDATTEQPEEGTRPDGEATKNTGGTKNATLESYTEADLAAQTKAKDKQAKADQDADETAKAEAEKRNVRDRSVGAASEFQLGQSAEDNLAGQKDIFSAPEPKKTEPKPEPTNIIALADIPRTLKITIEKDVRGKTKTKLVNARKAMTLATQRVEKLQALKRCLG